MEDRMAMLTKGTWVVVADSERAMVLKNMGDTRAPVLRQVHRLEAAQVLNAANPVTPVFDQGRDQRTPVAPPDRMRIAAEAMAGDVVAYLATQATKDKFDKLVLAAPPQVLGALRDQMDDALRARVSAELPKTLTGHPLAKIGELVAEALAKG